MHFIYHDPHTVLSPKKFIRNIDVLYDGGATGFSLAVIDWEGTPHMGMRWNVAIKEQSDEQKLAGSIQCCGSPSANGKPSWFILPRELFDPALFDRNSETFLALVAGWRK